MSDLSVSTAVVPTRAGGVRFFLVLVALAALAYLGAAPFLATIIEAALAARGKPHPPLAVLVLAQGAQVLVLVALAAFAGIRLAPRTGLDAPRLRALALGLPAAPGFGKLTRESLLLGTVIAVATALALLAVRPFAPPELWKTQGAPGFWLGASSAFFGGVIEELLMRWGVLTALYALVRKLGVRDGFWLANVATALLFGAGHLPAVFALGLPHTPAVFAHVLLGNGVAGLFLGWAFRRRGLESAMIAHGAADVWLHGVLPFVIQ